jgi:AcrR family transcriptional regulator
MAPGGRFDHRPVPAAAQAGRNVASPSVSPLDPILTAAAELFEEHGYDRVSVDAIAERSGFARSTVFARYSNKETLLVGIVRAFFERFPGPFVRRAAALAGNGESTRSEGMGVDGSGPASAPAADPAERIPAALVSFVEQAGPLARVALSARDLPWVRRTLDRQGFDIGVECAGCLGPGADDPLFVNLTVDVLKCLCLDGRNGPKCIDETKAARLLALLHMWAPALDRPGGSGSGG